MGSPYDTDVLIVGLGPVGAALANLLGRYGVRVAGDRQGRLRSSPSRARSRWTTRRCASCSGWACATASSRRWRSHRSSTTRRCSGASHASTAPASSTVTRCSSRSTNRSSSTCCARSSHSTRASRCGSESTLEGFDDDGRQVQRSPDWRRRHAVSAARALPGRRRRRELAGASPARHGLRGPYLRAGLADRRCTERAEPDRPRASSSAIRAGRRRTWSRRADASAGSSCSSRANGPRRWSGPIGTPAARTLVRRRPSPRRAHRGVPLPCPRGEVILEGSLLPRRRRRAHHAAVRRPGPGRRTARCREPRMEAGLGRSAAQAGETILDSYDAERRPHARKIRRR